MKIIFICGSLNPGKDGVGDYTRRLAGILTSQAHQVILISFSEKNITNAVIGFQEANGQKIEVMRFSQKMLLSHRLQLIKEKVTAFQPGWISLQYVPFAYHDKGLHFGFASSLAGISGNAQWHIMFHELWIGRDIGSSVKTRLFSFLQQQLIQRLIKKLRPTIVHTHLPLYQARMKALKIIAHPLPLFSNIQVVKSTLLNKETNFSIAFFSQAEASTQIVSFIQTISLQAIQHHRIPNLVMIGGNSEKMKTVANSIRQACPMIKAEHITGFLTDCQISEIIAGCDLGITPVPQHALGKSGTVAAFFAHGIPVAAPIASDAYASTGIGFFNQDEREAILTEPTWEKWASAKLAAAQAAKDIDVEVIARQFSMELLKNNN